MANAKLHPWIHSPEALMAAEHAIQIPLLKLPDLASMAGPDELEFAALMILQECAERHQHQGECKNHHSIPGAHVGAMWEWPEADRERYAVRTVGYALCSYLRTRHHA